MKKMVTGLRWQCPPGLIERALAEHPINDEVVVLNEPTGDFFYEMWKTKDEYKDTVWEEVLDTLPYSVGEARIITLKPGESYQSHADIDNRWHLNLTGEHSFLIDLETQEMFKCERNNHWYYMQTDNLHTACNFGSIPRLQLVVREPLHKSTKTDLISVAITQTVLDPENRYRFDNIFSPWLNRVNNCHKMSDFVFTDTLVTFKLASELKDELEKLKTSHFIITYD
jgi:hypothetical protein